MLPQCSLTYLRLCGKAFIDWAKQRIEDYAEVFRRQVYVSDVEPKVVEEALRITFSQSRKV